MSDPAIEPAAPLRLQDDKILPAAIYVLFIAAPLNGITAVIAVILAHVSRAGAPEWLASHYEFQIRTFWLSLIFAIGAAMLSVFGVGIVLFAAIGVWAVVRAIVGLSTLLKGQPYPPPRNWML